ncbi:hypothetical protein F4780DRAFT_149596 [Xylariomycetidae sp. FL0641]|nr:hypothetical protein F4780DRAFT_149596 [Xylariomycetidae sp. FL0641]
MISVPQFGLDRCKNGTHGTKFVCAREDVDQRAVDGWRPGLAWNDDGLRKVGRRQMFKCFPTWVLEWFAGGLVWLSGSLALRLLRLLSPHDSVQGSERAEGRWDCAGLACLTGLNCTLEEWERQGGSREGERANGMGNRWKGTRQARFLRARRSTPPFCDADESHYPPCPFCPSRLSRYPSGGIFPTEAVSHGVSPGNPSPEGAAGRHW